MLVSSAILLVAAAIVLVLFLRRRKNVPPGPMGVPFLGYLPFLGKNSANTYMDIAKKYGPVFSLNHGSITSVILCDSDVIHEALTERGADFSGRPSFYLFEKSARGYGVLFQGFNDTYKTQIKFSYAVTKSLGKRTAEKKISNAVAQFLQVVELTNEKSFESRDAVTKTVCSIICQIFMGKRYKYDDEEFTKITEMSSRVFADKRYAMSTGLMTFIPMLRYIPPLSTAYKTFLKDVKGMLDVIQTIVSEHKKDLDFDNPRDFIDEYLVKIQQTRDENSTFNEPQLCELIREFFVGAMTPITNTYRWILLSLAHYPEKQEKIFQEVTDVIGEDTPMMGHGNKMPYTRAFTQEIMRHRTVVPMGVPHATVADVKFQGFLLPKEMPIWINIWAAHRDPKYFTSPDEFNPERFIDEEGTFIKSDRVIPFGVGSRHCLAVEIGYMSIFLFLVHVVQKYRITPPEDKSTLPDFDDGIMGNSYEPFEFKVSFVKR